MVASIPKEVLRCRPILVQIAAGSSKVFRAWMTPEQTAAWRVQYRETSEALETIRAQELAALTNEDVLCIIRSLGARGLIGRD